MIVTRCAVQLQKWQVIGTTVTPKSVRQQSFIDAGLVDGPRSRHTTASEGVALLFIKGSKSLYCIHSGGRGGVFGYISPKHERIWKKPGI